MTVIHVLSTVYESGQSIKYMYLLHYSTSLNVMCLRLLVT